MPGVHVSHLTPPELAEAYPLVRASAHVTQASWENFARAIIAAGGGVLGARTSEGCVYGIASFRPL